jgi:hypothetical protein
VELNLDYLSKDFKKEILKNKDYKEALRLVKRNTQKNLWIGGSFVYKTLAGILYSQDLYADDFDFFAEKVNEPLRLPKGWVMNYGKFKSPEIVRASDNLEIDLIPLDNIYHLKENSLEPTIENFLLIAPLNIFSIVYSVYDKKLIGEAGKISLEQRIIRVNNLKSAQEMAIRYNTTVKDLVRKKAEELNFKAEYP